MRESNIFYHTSSIGANRGWRRKTWSSFTDKDGEMSLTSKGNDREAYGKYWFLLNILNVFFSSIRAAFFFFLGGFRLVYWWIDELVISVNKKLSATSAACPKLWLKWIVLLRPLSRSRAASCARQPCLFCTGLFLGQLIASFFTDEPKQPSWATLSLSHEQRRRQDDAQAGRSNVQRHSRYFYPNSAHVIFTRGQTVGAKQSSLLELGSVSPRLVNRGVLVFRSAVSR